VLKLDVGTRFIFSTGSEIAFWPNAYEIASGLMRSVANVPGTEIIIESTSNGIGDLFHDMWQGAQDEGNGYRPIFLPWTVDPTCSMLVPDGHIFSPEELEYQNLWKLNDSQLYWRSVTLKQLGEAKFVREYPITALEAFRNIDESGFITSDLVLKARKNEVHPDKQAPLILGVDVATTGADHTVIAWRRGHIVEKYKKLKGLQR